MYHIYKAFNINLSLRLQVVQQGQVMSIISAPLYHLLLPVLLQWNCLYLIFICIMMYVLLLFWYLLDISMPLVTYYIELFLIIHTKLVCPS